MKQKIELQLDRIKAEVIRAISIHRPMASPHEAYAVILEEFEEFWENVKINPKKLTNEEYRKVVHDMQSELIQIAAMCIRATIDCHLIDHK